MIRKLQHAEIAARRYSPAELAHQPRFPIALLLHNIRSAYNVGSIFRTADAARIAKLFLCGFTPSPPHREIAKTALDATETVPWQYERSIFTAIHTLRSEGYCIAALEITSASRLYCDLHPHDFPLALIIGNEISGVDDEILQQVDFALEIPMFGLKHSLNVSVATGIAVYTALQSCSANFTRLPGHDSLPAYPSSAS